MKYIVAALGLIAGTAAFAGDIVVEDAYARVARPGAPVGAAYFVITNTGDEADTLIGVASDSAKRVELHTHIEQNDVMMMRPIEGGIVIEPASSHTLERGGDHVMLMGLTERLEDGMEIDLTLTFENGGDLTISVPLDNERSPKSN